PRSQWPSAEGLLGRPGRRRRRHLGPAPALDAKPRHGTDDDVRGPRREGSAIVARRPVRTVVARYRPRAVLSEPVRRMTMPQGRAGVEQRLRAHVTLVIALVGCVVLLAIARPPRLPVGDRAMLARRFAFERLPLPEIPGAVHKTERSVNPTFARHAAWISALGAAVALADLDGDGIAND